MAELYVKQVDSAPEHTEPSEVVEEQDFITLEEGGQAHVTDPANDDVVDAIVPHRERGQHLPEHEYDFSEPQYEAGVFGLPFYEMDEVGYAIGATPRDSSVTAPSIDINTVVGVVNLNGRPVVVEEGYTADPDGDGTDTTYNRSNGNFLPLGLADEEVTSTNEDVRVRVRTEMLASR